MKLPGCCSLHLFPVPLTLAHFRLCDQPHTLNLQILTSGSHTIILPSVLDFRCWTSSYWQQVLPFGDSSICTKVSWRPSLLTPESKQGLRHGRVWCGWMITGLSPSCGPLHHKSPQEAGTEVHIGARDKVLICCRSINTHPHSSFFSSVLAASSPLMNFFPLTAGRLLAPSQAAHCLSLSSWA